MGARVAVRVQLDIPSHSVVSPILGPNPCKKWPECFSNFTESHSRVRCANFDMRSAWSKKQLNRACFLWAEGGRDSGVPNIAALRCADARCGVAASERCRH